MKKEVNKNSLLFKTHKNPHQSEISSLFSRLKPLNYIFSRKILRLFYSLVLNFSANKGHNHTNNRQHFKRHMVNIFKYLLVHIRSYRSGHKIYVFSSRNFKNNRLIGYVLICSPEWNLVRYWSIRIYWNLPRFSKKYKK